MNQQVISQTTQRELDRLFANAALISDHGVIVAVNRAWQAFAATNRCSMQDYGIGANYLQICETAANTGIEEARIVAAGIRSVAAGKRRRFVYHYDNSWRVECWQVAAGLIVAHFPVV